MQRWAIGNNGSAKRVCEMPRTHSGGVVGQTEAMGVHFYPSALSQRLGEAKPGQGVGAGLRQRESGRALLAWTDEGVCPYATLRFRILGFRILAIPAPVPAEFPTLPAHRAGFHLSA